MFEELKCPQFDFITKMWFVPLKDEKGYLNVTCVIIHDSELKRNNLNQVYFATEHHAHLAAAAYYLTNPTNTEYPYNAEWDACAGIKLPNDTSDEESIVMEFE